MRKVYSEPLISDNFLTENIINAVNNKYGTYMKFGHVSNQTKEYDYGHFAYHIEKNTRAIPIDIKLFPEFEKTHPVLMDIIDGIQNVLGPRGIVRSYIKQYVYGTDAYQHTDVTKNWENDCETVIIYLTPDWKPDYMGMTVIYDETGEEIVTSVVPKYNRLFAFDGRQPHSTCPLTRMCPVTKKILVFNLMPCYEVDKGFLFLKKYLDDEKYAHGAGGTLFQHLCNVFRLLDRTKTFPGVWAIAGLWHSIYGTQYYDKGQGEEISRDFVKNMIGEQAEELVYEFCTMENRTQNIIEGNNMGLKAIEYANILDINNHKPDERRKEKIIQLNGQLTDYFKEDTVL